MKNKTKTITIPVTPEEKEQIQKIAVSNSLTTGSYIRYVIMKEVNNQ